MSQVSTSPKSSPVAQHVRPCSQYPHLKMQQENFLSDQPGAGGGDGEGGGGGGEEKVDDTIVKTVVKIL